MGSERKNNVMITGGTSGLGRSLVKLFVSEGWNVATLGRRSDLLERLTGEFPEESLLAVQCDIKVESQLRSFFSKVEEKFGFIDVAILNAGTLGPSNLPVLTGLSLLDLRMTFETNLFANFNVLRKSLDLRRKKQIVVHVTSDAVNGKYPGWGAYGASKTAMDFLISTLQNEMDPDQVRAVSFDPGDMDTEMHRLALPDDVSLKDPDDSAKELFELVEKLRVDLR